MRYTIAKPRSIYELGARANQEDNIYPRHGEATSADSLFIVCDGMGGHESGEIASSTVCEQMSNYINNHVDRHNFDQEDFQAALSAAYDSLDALDSGSSRKMGTTMTFMKLHSRGCLMAHIGDSRMYHIRTSTEEKILFKSRDHSLVNNLIDIGELTAEQAKTSNQKNVITRAIQPNQERRAKATIQLISDIQPGDYFYICTDGMLENMEDENIINILSMSCDDDEKIGIFTQASNGNRDNHSAYLIRIKEVLSENRAPSDNITTKPKVKKETKATTPIEESPEQPPKKAPEQKKKAQLGTKNSFNALIKLTALLIIIFSAALITFKTLTKSDNKQQKVLLQKELIKVGNKVRAK